MLLKGNQKTQRPHKNSVLNKTAITEFNLRPDKAKKMSSTFSTFKNKMLTLERKNNDKHKSKSVIKNDTFVVEELHFNRTNKFNDFVLPCQPMSSKRSVNLGDKLSWDSRFPLDSATESFKQIRGDCKEGHQFPKEKFYKPISITSKLKSKVQLNALKKFEKHFHGVKQNEQHNDNVVNPNNVEKLFQMLKESQEERRKKVNRLHTQTYQQQYRQQQQQQYQQQQSQQQQKQQQQQQQQESKNRNQPTQLKQASIKDTDKQPIQKINSLTSKDQKAIQNQASQKNKRESGNTNLKTKGNRFQAAQANFEDIQNLNFKQKIGRRQQESIGRRQQESIGRRQQRVGKRQQENQSTHKKQLQKQRIVKLQKKREKPSAPVKKVKKTQPDYNDEQIEEIDFKGNKVQKKKIEFPIKQSEVSQKGVVKKERQKQSQRQKEKQKQKQKQRLKQKQKEKEKENQRQKFDEEENEVIDEFMFYLERIDDIGQFRIKSKDLYKDQKIDSELLEANLVASFYMSQQFVFYIKKVIDVLDRQTTGGLFTIDSQEVEILFSEGVAEEELPELQKHYEAGKKLAKAAHQDCKKYLSSDELLYQLPTRSFFLSCSRFLIKEYRKVHGIYKKDQKKVTAKRCCYLIEIYLMLKNLNGEEEIKDFQDVDDDIADYHQYIQDWGSQMG